MTSSGTSSRPSLHVVKDTTPIQTGKQTWYADSRGTTGDGGGGGGMESRMAKVEASVEHIQTDITDIRDDIRDIRNYGTTIALVLFALVFGTGVYINDKISDNNDAINLVNLSIEKLSSKSDLILFNVKSNVNKIDELSKEKANTGE